MTQSALVLKMTGGDLQYADIGQEADDGIKMPSGIQSSGPFSVSCERRSVLRPRHLFLQIYSAAETDGRTNSIRCGWRRF